MPADTPPNPGTRIALPPPRSISTASGVLLPSSGARYSVTQLPCTCGWADLLGRAQVDGGLLLEASVSDVRNAAAVFLGPARPLRLSAAPSLAACCCSRGRHPAEATASPPRPAIASLQRRRRSFAWPPILPCLRSFPRRVPAARTSRSTTRRASRRRTRQVR
jgi:hypothetical protein